MSKDTPKDDYLMCAGMTSVSCDPTNGGVASKCAWSNGKDMIPDYDFCAPMDMTTDVQLIERCVAADTVALCNQGCQWRQGSKNTPVVVDPTKPDQIPLFTKEFCHPVIATKDTPIAVFEQCVKSDTMALCSISAGCNWSTGKELIPDHDFCAPMDLTDDINLIQRCLSADTTALCNQGCQWRHGDGNNTAPVEPLPVPLFKTDFCHPVTFTADWTLCVNQKTSVDCSLEKDCNWSTGKDLIPTTQFCAPAELTDDIDMIKTCLMTQTTALCSIAKCQWRDGLNQDGTKPVPAPVTPVDPVVPVNPAGFCKWTPAAPMDTTVAAAATDYSGYTVTTEQAATAAAAATAYSGYTVTTEQATTAAAAAANSGYTVADMPTTVAGAMTAVANVDPCYKIIEA